MGPATKDSNLIGTISSQPSKSRPVLRLFGNCDGLVQHIVIDFVVFPGKRSRQESRSEQENVLSHQAISNAGFGCLFSPKGGKKGEVTSCLPYFGWDL